MSTSPKTILITGASSGIGAALAEIYAAAGVHLLLLGRSTERLQTVAKQCEQRGATVAIVSVDVRDADAMKQCIQTHDAKTPIDLVIANAGVSAGTFDGMESDAQVRAIFDINVDGVINTVMPLVSRMSERKRGHIAIMSSLASFHPFPSAPAYCASKVAVRFWGESIRGLMKSHGVTVSVLCPGYIKTPMTDVNTFHMPFIMSAEKAARIIKNALDKKRKLIVFPRALAWPLALITRFPRCCTMPIVDNLPAKKPLQ